MGLTHRSSGVGGGLVTTTWFNDFYDLLTGAMVDQEVTLQTNLVLQRIGVKPSAACGGSTATGTTLGVGVYKYWYSYANDDGETALGPVFSITTTTGNTNVHLTGITVGPTGTKKRIVYRTAVGGSNSKYLATINDNTTTTLTDSTADGSLGAIGPMHLAGGYTGVYANTLGGSLVYKDESANIRAWTYCFDEGGSNAGMVTILNSNSYSFTVKRADGTGMMQSRWDGSFCINGIQYQTQNGSIATVTGSTFYGNDVAEIFQCDQEYPQGTVVCPGDNNLMVLCTHVNCHAASVVSYTPGLGLGANDHAAGKHYIALAGRVNVRTDADIQPRELLVSDGKGGVRGVVPGEGSFVIGFALNNTCVEGDMKGTVGVFLRSMFVIIKA